MLNRLERDQDNLRAALAWLLDEDPEQALRLALCFETFWSLRGRVEEGTRWFAQVLERTRGSLTGARAHALREAASFAEMTTRSPLSDSTRKRFASSAPSATSVESGGSTGTWE
jgi:hypothetical protein